jgi:adenylosuccinate synthase
MGKAQDVIEKTLAGQGTVLIEGAQGYGLGLRTEFYPKCTSSDCDAGTMMAMAGAVPWSPYVKRFEVWVVFRTLPIRVAGNSGPLKNETTWAELGLAAEHTTVTGKVRRVGLWDRDLAARAMRANGGPGRNVRVAVTGLDLLFGDLAEKRGKWESVDELWEHDEAWAWILQREEELGCTIDAVGIGPEVRDVLWK